MHISTADPCFEVIGHAVFGGFVPRVREVRAMPFGRMAIYGVMTAPQHLGDGPLGRLGPPRVSRADLRSRLVSWVDGNIGRISLC